MTNKMKRYLRLINISWLMLGLLSCIVFGIYSIVHGQFWFTLANVAVASYATIRLRQLGRENIKNGSKQVEEA